MPPTSSAMPSLFQVAPAPTAMSSFLQMVPFLIVVGIVVSVVALVRSVKRRSTSAEPAHLTSGELPDSVMYHVVGYDGQQYGPVAGGTIRDWIGKRLIGASSLSFRDGEDHWTPLGERPEFNDFFRNSGAPPSQRPLPRTPPPLVAGLMQERKSWSAGKTVGVVAAGIIGAIVLLSLIQKGCGGGLSSLVGRNVTVIAKNYIDGGTRTIHLTSTGYIEVKTSSGMSLTMGEQRYEAMNTPNANCVGYKLKGFGDIGYTLGVCAVTRAFSATGKGEDSDGQSVIQFREGDLYFVEENISQSYYYRIEVNR